MKKITRTQVFALMIPLPNFKDQMAIANKLEKQMKMVDQTRLDAEAELAAIEALPSAILRKAFNGDI
jgi:restriction endonuclease S subunit